MGRTLVWSLCFGVAVTASASAGGLTPAEPTNPALRLAVDGQADPLASPDSAAVPVSKYSGIEVFEPGYTVTTRYSLPTISLAQDARPDPFQTMAGQTETGLTSASDLGPQQARTVNLEYTLSAPARATGLNIDLALAPRAGVSIGPEGSQIRSVGGEVRLGKRLEGMVGKFDSNTATWDRPSWYFFAATDGSALTWTPEMMAAGARRGVSYQEDRIIVGDAQIGVTMEANGMQASLGFTNREVSNGPETVDENFVGATFTMRR